MSSGRGVGLVTAPARKLAGRRSLAGRLCAPRALAQVAALECGTRGPFALPPHPEV